MYDPECNPDLKAREYVAVDALEAVIDQWVNQHDAGRETDEETLAVFAFIGDVLRPALAAQKRTAKP